jgi:hypothetical protein
MATEPSVASELMALEGPMLEALPEDVVQARLAHWRRWHGNPIWVQVPPVGELCVRPGYRRVEGSESMREMVADAHKFRFFGSVDSVHGSMRKKP